ncbi:MAG: thiolase family protein [Candidatus Eisenbacteria bacterium]|uniref:Thiolase family protein n=1 Tax=Eiseniibacteriota bacterium TaxID=2212470 RepID=A0A849SHQ5_UNCEI|nr:thiolase family protein [Candidatus Eisenbacteria bacterium]
MTTSRVFLAGGVRTPVGKFGGALAASSAAELGGLAAKACLERTRVPLDAVDEVLIGHARQAGNGPNLARQVVRRSGLPDSVPAFTINKACASGLQAIVSGVQSVRLADSQVALAGGVEHMSSIPFLATDMRWGKKLGDEALVDAMFRDGYQCPLCNQLMGETAETLATEYAITREEQDAYALESNRRAARAWSEGRFAGEVVPVTIGSGRSLATVAQDEHFRGDATLDEMAKLRPVFRKDGTITAANASAITDGAAAVLVLSEQAATRHGISPQAAVLGYTSVAVDPARMGISPVPAVRKLLERHHLTLDQIDVVELNEAFAAQVLACDRELHFDRARLNPNGGGISLGHPTGCSGTRIVVGLLSELARTGGRYGLATLCVSGGIGMALLVERV